MSFWRSQTDKYNSSVVGSVMWLFISSILVERGLSPSPEEMGRPPVEAISLFMTSCASILSPQSSFLILVPFHYSAATLVAEPAAILEVITHFSRRGGGTLSLWLAKREHMLPPLDLTILLNISLVSLTTHKYMHRLMLGLTLEGFSFYLFVRIN